MGDRDLTAAGDDTSARRRFLRYMRDPQSARPVLSPFLPHPDVVREALAYLHLPVTQDPVLDELELAGELDYEPMFMTECSALIFDWQIDEARSVGTTATKTISTRKGEWVRQSTREDVPWSDEAGCAVRSLRDHEMLVAVCEEVGEREASIRGYFRSWRQKVGEGGVIVIGHPHPSWLGYQINPSEIFYQWKDCREVFCRSMDAIYEASLFVMSIAMEEGIDFMSDSSYGLEMTSPTLFMAMDYPYIRKFADWTHNRGGLFWYHNCGRTRQLIRDGTFNRLGADLIETVAPPPEGDNDLAESRRSIDRGICTKGNLNLWLLRDGTPHDVCIEAARIVNAVRGYAHVFSTADAVLPGTPPENFVAFVQEVRRQIGS